ncbi:MAG: putative addiction module antidote protein [Brevundimonas sp.]|nr:MAG: putative addiction module antidote protein [Brevundimonas sp.]
MAINTIPFDAAEFLDTPEGVEEFLVASFESAFEFDDPRLITDALGIVARTRGMAKMAEDTELSRTALYRALSADGRPELATIFKVMQALGLRLAPVLKQSAIKSAA